MNISSIVIKTNPQNLDEVLKELNESEICDVHMHDEFGRIVVTIEGEGISEEIKKLKILETMPNVISADMIYSYAEDELNEARENFDKNGGIPDVLKDDNLKAEDITYRGDLKKKM